MGSGCDNSKMNGYFGTPIPDKGIKYTGPAIPALGICTGDFLNELEAIILAKLLDFMEGKGINIPDINLEECPFIQEFVLCCAQDKSLTRLLDILFKAVCSLKSDLTVLEDRVNEILNITFNMRCLTVSVPTIGNVINEIIREFCLLKTRVEVIEATLIDLQTQIDNIANSLTETITELINSIVDERIGNYLLNNVFSCNGFGLSKSGTGATAQLQFNGMVPPMCPIPYLGSLTNFDNTGAGLPNKGYCGWFICNGLNSTPDMRGYTFASATTNVTGNALDARVSSYPTNMGDKNGEQKHILITSELPSSGSGSGSTDIPVVYGANGSYHANVPNSTSTTAFLSYKGIDGAAFTLSTSPNSTAAQEQGTFDYGLTYGARPPLFWEGKGAVRTKTISSGSGGSGSDAPHENRQPTVYGVWIMRFN